MFRFLAILAASFTAVSATYGQEKADALQWKGVLAPAQAVEIASTIGGRITKVLIEPGAEVKKDQVLVELESNAHSLVLERARADVLKAEANFKVAQARMNLAQRDFERVRQAYSKGVSSENEMNVAQANFELSKAALQLEEAGIAAAKVGVREAELVLSNCVIRSPLDGTVLHLRAAPGQAVRAGPEGAFCVVASFSPMRIVGDVDERIALKIVRGQAAEFRVDALPDVRGIGKVIAVRPSPSGDKSRPFQVEVLIDNADRKLIPNLSASVTLDSAKR